MYACPMIKSFKDGRTEAIYQGKNQKGLPSDVLRRAVAKLFLLDTATRLEDLAVPRGTSSKLSRVTAGARTRSV